MAEIARDAIDRAARAMVGEQYWPALEAGGQRATLSQAKRALVAGSHEIPCPNTEELPVLCARSLSHPEDCDVCGNSGVLRVIPTEPPA